VAELLESGVTNAGVPYIVMPFLQGEDLGSRIERGGPLPPREVARIISQLGKGLSRAHQLGLVHRNIKPGNVMLIECEDGETCAKVLDFGLSQHVTTSGMGHTAGGSILFNAPAYASPEQLFGVKDVDFRADLWAMAVLAYFALMGKTPFSDMAPHELANSMREGGVLSPSAYATSLGPGVDAWFERALQRDPAARFTSARELGDELERALGVELDARSSRTSYPGNRPSSPGLRVPSSPGRAEDVGERIPISVTGDRIPTSVTGERIPISVAPRTLRQLNLPRESHAEIVTIQPPQQRKSSALLLLALALGGIAAIGTGLTLLSRQDPVRPHHVGPSAGSSRTSH
jgi:serine/threonine-protein kinase